MKNRLFSTLRLVSMIPLFMLVFILPTVFLPASESLLARLNPKEMEMFFPLLFLFAIYISTAFWFLIKNTNQSKPMVLLKLVATTFLMFPLMGYIEAIFWLDELNVVNDNEFVKIFFRALITFILFSGFITLIHRKQIIGAKENNRLNLKMLLKRLLLIAAVYIFIYNLFGYFVAWQFEATRVYYTGSAELKGFFTMFFQNFSDPVFVLVHFLRGILFGLSGYILYTMLNCSKLKKAIILGLIMGAFGFQIILPNPIFPEAVRISHFLETSSSMIVFGVIVGYILDFGKSENK